MDREAWRAAVRGDAEQTRFSKQQGVGSHKSSSPGVSHTAASWGSQSLQVSREGKIRQVPVLGSASKEGAPTHQTGNWCSWGRHDSKR